MMALYLCVVGGLQKFGGFCPEDVLMPNLCLTLFKVIAFIQVSDCLHSMYIIDILQQMFEF